MKLNLTLREVIKNYEVDFVVDNTPYKAGVTLTSDGADLWESTIEVNFIKNENGEQVDDDDFDFLEKFIIDNLEQ